MSTTAKKPRKKKFKPSLETWNECTTEQKFQLARYWFGREHSTGAHIRALQQVEAWKSKREKLTDITEKLQCDEQIERWAKKSEELTKYAWYLATLLYELSKRPEMVEELMKERTF